MIYLCMVCELVGIDDERQRLVKDENCNTVCTVTPMTMVMDNFLF